MRAAPSCAHRCRRGRDRRHICSDTTDSAGTRDGMHLRRLVRRPHPVPQPGVHHERTRGAAGRRGRRVEPGGDPRRPVPLRRAQRRPRTRRRGRIPRCGGEAAARCGTRGRRHRTIGGDVFLVICPGIATAVEAVRTATRVAESLSHEIQLKDIKLGSRASIGVAWAGDPGIDARDTRRPGRGVQWPSRSVAAGGEPVLFSASLSRTSPESG